jgi:hypothetical protein
MKLRRDKEMGLFFFGLSGMDFCNPLLLIGLCSFLRFLKWVCLSYFYVFLFPSSPRLRRGRHPSHLIYFITHAILTCQKHRLAYMALTGRIVSHICPEVKD